MSLLNTKNKILLNSVAVLIFFILIVLLVTYFLQINFTSSTIFKEPTIILLCLLTLLIGAIHLGFKSLVDRLDMTINKLEDNKNFTDSILNNSSHAIIATNKDGVITLFNQKAEEMLGYKANDMIDKNTPEIFHKSNEIEERAKELSQEFHKDIKIGFDTFILKNQLGLKNNDHWIYVTKTGKEFPVSLSISTLTNSNGCIDGYLGIAENITEQKVKEKLINNYIELVDKNIIISTTDLKGNITYVSDAFCKVSGYSKSELICSSHKIIRHPDMKKEFFQNMWNTIILNNIWQGEIKCVNKNKKYYWVEASISPIFDENGEKIGYTAIRQEITDKKIIENISITDGLTNIYNRRHFNDIFPKVINSAKRDNSLVSFLIMDIDYFKQYNDNYGHQMGDEVLKRVAMYLKNSLNRADDHCFRLGGEEFGMIFKVDKKEKAFEFAELIRKKIEELNIEHSSNKVSNYVTVSIGLFCNHINKVKNDDIIYKETDDLLYKAKNYGRNQVVSNI